MNKYPTDSAEVRASAQHAYSCRSYGLGIAIRCDDEAALDQLVFRLPPGNVLATSFAVHCEFSVVTKGLSGKFELYRDGARLACMSVWEELLEHFESCVGHYVAENALDFIFIHAGCVSWKGKAIVIPGRSFSGKTSLVAEFLRAGATYYSDEYCVLDQHGMIHPYPRRLSMRTKNGRLRVTAAELGTSVGSSGVSAGCLLYTSFQPGALWQPTAITAGESVILLLDNTVCARKKPEAALRVLGTLAQSAQALSSVRGEADACVAYFLNGA